MRKGADTWCLAVLTYPHSVEGEHIPHSIAGPSSVSEKNYLPLSLVKQVDEVTANLYGVDFCLVV